APPTPVAAAHVALSLPSLGRAPPQGVRHRRHHVPTMRRPVALARAGQGSWRGCSLPPPSGRAHRAAAPLSCPCPAVLEEACGPSPGRRPPILPGGVGPPPPAKLAPSRGAGRGSARGVTRCMRPYSLEVPLTSRRAGRSPRRSRGHTSPRPWKPRLFHLRARVPCPDRIP